MRLVLVGAGVEELLREPQLAVAADERRLEALRLQSAGPTGRHAESPPELHRLRLALQLVETGVGVRDRRFRRPPRRIADEHRVRLGGALHPGGGVDEVARDHALPGGAEVDRRLAGEHGGAGAELRHPRLGAERAHRGDELERRAHGALGVVLLRHRRAPHGHHRVADELLDDAAVATDDVGGDLEVPRQEVAHLFGVAVFRERREADEVGEEHGDEPPLDGDCRLSAGLRRGRPAASRTRRRTSAPAGSRRRTSEHVAASAVPHSPQNFWPSGFSAPQFEQVITQSAFSMRTPPSSMVSVS